ncbi:hypothetical protein I5M27_03830 [Adhaeribacter sp. BT258]|uniref:Uncharacterized protein n=1 Tax=Adhaeribacter terrigena TaxID=2793070 RepID=A0ABS1BYB9_9BACT|nr:hypothetical protein [Adhaeribacter terrigena]MBK0402099.1 hypothetical protein [Adhaeribacter terrigena]
MPEKVRDVKFSCYPISSKILSGTLPFMPVQFADKKPKLTTDFRRSIKKTFMLLNKSAQGSACFNLVMPPDLSKFVVASLPSPILLHHDH